MDSSNCLWVIGAGMNQRGSYGSFLGGVELESGVAEPEEEGSLEAMANHWKPAPIAH